MIQRSCLAMGLALAWAAHAHAQVPTNNLTLWLDASAIPGLSDGASVASWTNKSTLVTANPAQATAGAQPTYKTGILNGLPVVRFDGTTGYLESIAMTNFVSLTAYTIFTVFNTDAISTDHASSWRNDALVEDSSGFVGQLFKGSQAIAFNWDGTDDRVGTPVSVAAWHMLETRHESGTLYIHKNNESDSSTASGTTPAFGAPVRIGLGHATFNNYFDGDIAEMLIYNTALSLQDRKHVENYLGDKYGIVVPEPSALALLAAGFLLAIRRRFRS